MISTLKQLKQLECEESFSGRDNTVSIYKWDNVFVTVTDRVPRHIFSPNTQKVALDVVLEINDTNTKSVNAFGGTLSPDYYTEEGYGIPVFKCGDNRKTTLEPKPPVRDPIECAYKYWLTLNQ